MKLSETGKVLVLTAWGIYGPTVSFQMKVKVSLMLVVYLQIKNTKEQVQGNKKDQR